MRKLLLCENFLEIRKLWDKMVLNNYLINAQSGIIVLNAHSSVLDEGITMGILSKLGRLREDLGQLNPDIIKTIDSLISQVPLESYPD
jgi:hypothetical protein